MNRNSKLLLVSASLSLIGLRCTPDAAPKVDYDQVSINVMKDLAPQLVGTWKLRQVRVNFQGPNRINLTKDSTFQDLATLTVVPAAKPRTLPKDTRRGEFDGTLQFGNKTYPIQFDTWPGTWIYSGKGPQAFLLFSYQFPNGLHTIELEEEFLEKLGLIHETFSLETTFGQPTMKWVGLNRGIDQIDFVKQ